MFRFIIALQYCFTIYKDNKLFAIHVTLVVEFYFLQGENRRSRYKMVTFLQSITYGRHQSIETIKLLRYLTAISDYLDARATKFQILKISYQWI